MSSIIAVCICLFTSLKDDAFNIPHSFILRGHNTTQQASLEYHLDTIGTKLGLAKKDVLTPYLRTLATGGTYESEDSDFGKIIDPLQFGRMTFLQQHPMRG